MRFFHKAAVFTAVFALSGSVFAADPQLMNLVMPDAKIVAGLNVTTAKISPLGQYILQHVAASGHRGMESFVAETGFDPRQDVTEIVAASVTAQDKGLILARGTFNVEKIAAAAAKNASTQPQQYKGATLIVAGDGKASHAVAFIGNSIAVAGDPANVKAAIDRNSGAATAINPMLAARVLELSTTQDAWSVTLSSISALIPNVAGANVQGPGAAVFNLVKDVQQSSGGVKLGTNVEITAQAVTSDPKNATALSDVIKMFAGLASMAGAKDPKAAGFAQLLQKLQVNTVGTAVNIGLTIPEADLESLLRPAVVKPATRL